MSEKATPRPWAITTIRGGYLIEGPAGAPQRVVRGAGGVREEGDAVLIVTAVNNHEALVTALQAARELLARSRKPGVRPAYRDHLTLAAENTLVAALDALKGKE